MRYTGVSVPRGGARLGRSAKRWVWILLVAGLCAGSARADLIIFHDGRELEGEVVSEDADSYVVKGRFGQTRVPKREVQEIRKTKSPRTIFDERWAALDAADPKAKAEAWHELGAYATEQKLDKQAKQAYERAVALDPDLRAAHEALGHVRYLGAWVPLEEKMKAEGLVKVGERWVAQADAEAVAKPEMDLISPPNPLEPAGAVASTSSQLQPCGACNATGYARWFDCQQCRSSGRKGQINLGERWATCPRCLGKGDMPVLPCARCAASGKVDPQRPRTAGGAVIPPGFRECTACEGTGGGGWQDCDGCRRGRPRGYLNFGDRYEVCRSCMGRGQAPTKRCDACKGAQVVKNP